MSNTIRDAIGEALDFSFAEEAFELVDAIESNVRDGEPGGELHEVAAEITERLIETMSTRRLAILWVVLGADGASTPMNPPDGEQESTLDRIRNDVWNVVEAAVHAGLTAYAEEVEVLDAFEVVGHLTYDAATGELR